MGGVGVQALRSGAEGGNGREQGSIRGGAGSGSQKFVYQKWPHQIYRSKGGGYPQGCIRREGTPQAAPGSG